MKFLPQQKSEPFLYGAIALLLAGVFVADLATPLGIAVWVLYLFPTALAVFLWRPQVPVLVAAASTVLIITGYFTDAAGIDPALAQVNRTFGVLTCWIIAATGYVFIKSRLAVRRQDWLQAGQTQLMKAIAGELSLHELGDNLLSFLTGYLGAQAGAVFIQNGHDFFRAAAYGIDANAGAPRNISPGDGLLGQAIKDKRGFSLADVPDGYLHFGSGLARGKPRHLLIAPALADNDVNAVIELGFIGDAGALEAEFLERVAGAVGIAVRSVKYRLRQQELLEETQQQAEELQAQSEELRASNEELEQQSRSLQDAQARLEEQQSELEQTNAQLEEQTRLLEHQRDDLHTAQNALKSKAYDLEQASRYKSEFVANMSHELRTPLNSLLIMAKLLGDNRGGNLTAEQVKYAQTIEGSGRDLLTLINDILDISKIEAGRVEIQPGETSVAEVVAKLRKDLGPIAEERKLALRTEIAPDVPTLIETDKVRIEQVLRNFLSNALKFTEAGHVALKVRAAANDSVAFTVEDTGIGIAEDQQETIFEAFRQADGTINRKFGGTGLGLSISRELARLLGGAIKVESRLGHGSAFTLTVPCRFQAETVQLQKAAGGTFAYRRPPAPPRAAPSSPAAPDSHPGNPIVLAAAKRTTAVQDDREKLSGGMRTILVVEDDDNFARLLYDLAHELGFQCLVAGSADEGVMLARQYMPHAVILDIGLPDHTGLSVLDRLKRDARTRHMPVHVVSAEDYTQAALELGAMSYMLKPVKRETLIHAFEGLETKLAQKLRRVLIVEDDQTQLESLRSLLSSKDVETVGARSAAACLDKLKTETFDCMVLDLTLPDVSGFDLLEQLSQNDAFSFPPVIVYTGRDLSAEDELRLRKYSKSIIIKGAKSPERLLDEVTLFLHQVVSDLPEDKQLLLAKSFNRDAALDGKRILVVEDDVRNVFALTGIFEPHGAKVKIARNGREALKALEGGKPDVDLVLMDIMMPEMDGLTATRHIREKAEFKHLPIIALTAKAMASDQEECLAAGANDYLPKPLDVDKLLSLVRVWMPR